MFTCISPRDFAMDPEIERLVEQTLKDEEYDEYPPVQKENPSSRVVIIDNVPIIPKAKEPLLTKVLGMVTAKCGKVSEIFLPFDADGVKSLGYPLAPYPNDFCVLCLCPISRC